MHRLLRFFWGKEDIALNSLHPLIGYQEPVSVAMLGQAPGHVLGAAADGDEMARSKLNQIAFVRQPLQGVFEFAALFAVGAELLDELFVGGPSVRQRADVFQDRRLSDMLWHKQILSPSAKSMKLNESSLS